MKLDSITNKFYNENMILPRSRHRGLVKDLDRVRSIANESYMRNERNGTITKTDLEVPDLQYATVGWWGYRTRKGILKREQDLFWYDVRVAPLGEVEQVFHVSSPILHPREVIVTYNDLQAPSPTTDPAALDDWLASQRMARELDLHQSDTGSINHMQMIVGQFVARLEHETRQIAE